MDNTLAELRRRAAVSEFIETVGIEVAPGLIAQQGAMVFAEAQAAHAQQLRATVASLNSAMDRLEKLHAKNVKRIADLEDQVASLRASNKGSEQEE